MVDREKVINALEDYEPYAREFDSLSVYGWVVLDALALLKEQEPKAVILKDLSAYCPWCSTETTIKMGVQKLHLGTHFCPYCGQAVKWDD